MDRSFSRNVVIFLSLSSSKLCINRTSKLINFPFQTVAKFKVNNSSTVKFARVALAFCRCKFKQRSIMATNEQLSLLQMSGKRTRSFKCAVHHRDREVCSENDFHLLVHEPPLFRRYDHVETTSFFTLSNATRLPQTALESPTNGNIRQRAKFHFIARITFTFLSSFLRW